MLRAFNVIAGSTRNLIEKMPGRWLFDASSRVRKSSLTTFLKYSLKVNISVSNATPSLSRDPEAAPGESTVFEFTARKRSGLPAHYEDGRLNVFIGKYH